MESISPGFARLILSAEKAVVLNTANFSAAATFCSFPSSRLGMVFLKLQLPEERPSRSLKEKGSQAGILAVIHKSVRLEIVRKIWVIPSLLEKEVSRKARKGAKKSDFLCAFA